MKLKSILFSGIAVVLFTILSSCGGREYKKSPLDSYIVELSDEKEFSVIIEDMDVDGTFFKTYKHKYKVIRVADSIPTESTSDWKEVEKEFFWKNEGNLGMVVLEKGPDGSLSKVAVPPGYRYVGDSKYGEWRTHNGSSFWSFYGRYMFMSQMFGMMNRPVYRSDYNTYRGGGYYGKRSYYGPKEGKYSKYGTNSAQTKKSRPSFFSRRATKSGWSSSRSRSGGRSRGSGFGK